MTNVTSFSKVLEIKKRGPLLLNLLWYQLEKSDNQTYQRHSKVNPCSAANTQNRV